MRTFLLSLSAALLCGCAKTDSVQQEPMYFDLRGFLIDEIDRLNALDTCITKVVQIDSAKETMLVRHADTTFWMKELNLLLRADINVPAARGLYQKTIRRDAGADSVVTYASTVSKLETKEMSIHFENNAVTRVEAILEESNVVYRTRHVLAYEGHSYSVRTTQATRGTRERTFGVEGRVGCH